MGYILYNSTSSKLCSLFTLTIAIISIVVPINYHNNIKPEFNSCNITHVTNDITEDVYILGYTVDVYIDDNNKVYNTRYWLNIFTYEESNDYKLILNKYYIGYQNSCYNKFTKPFVTFEYNQSLQYITWRSSQPFIVFGCILLLGLIGFSIHDCYTKYND